MKSIVRVNESSIIDTQDIYRITPDGDRDDMFIVSLVHRCGKAGDFDRVRVSREVAIELASMIDAERDFTKEEAELREKHARRYGPSTL